MKKFLETFGFVVLLGASTMLEAVLPAPGCPVLGPNKEVVIYDDNLGFGFTKNVWLATASTVSDANSGNAALKVDFKQSWSGIEFNGIFPYSPKVVGAVQIAVKGTFAEQNIRIYLLDKDGRKLGVDMDLSNYTLGGLKPYWEIAEIPIADLYKNTNSSIYGVGVQAENPGTIWIDDIKFVTPEPSGLVTLYDDHLHAKQHSWLGVASPEKSTPFAGDKALKLQITSAWGGMTLYSDRPISEKDFGAITLAVKTNTNDIDLYVYAVNKNGDRIGLARPLSEFLYGGAIPKSWQVAWVPIQELIPHPKPGTFVFYGIGIESTMPGTVWVDEVKVREEFKLPLPSGKSWWLTVEAGGLAYDGSKDQYHAPSNGYYSLDFAPLSGGGVSESAVPILAAASGLVVAVGDDQYNGTYAIINHDRIINSTSIGYTTTYIHMEKNSRVVNSGDFVQQGQKLGIMGNTGISTGTHLHVGFKFNGQNSISTHALKFIRMEGRRIEDYNVIVGDPKEYYPSTNVQQ